MQSEAKPGSAAAAAHTAGMPSIRDSPAGGSRGEPSGTGTARTHTAAADADAKMSPVPKRVVQLSDIVAVAAGADHTVVACARGVYTFGCNSHGQLGHGSTQDAHVPLRVKLLSQTRESVTQVAAGHHHTLFITDAHRAYAAGSCEYGQFTPDAGASAGSSSASSAHIHPAPVRAALPFLEGANGEQRAVLHEARAGGHASVFLIRAPDDPVRAWLSKLAVLCGPCCACLAP